MIFWNYVMQSGYYYIISFVGDSVHIPLMSMLVILEMELMFKYINIQELMPRYFYYNKRQLWNSLYTL